MNLHSVARCARGLALPLVLSLAAPLHAQTVTPEPANDDYARARALYQHASQAFEAGRYPEARRLLLDAWALRKSYDVAASLGDTELKLGLFADAAEHLSFSVRTFPPLENEQALASVRRQLEMARQKAAALRIAVDEPDAEVRVDQRLVGKSPLEDAVFVSPGRHTVEARKGTAVATGAVVSEVSEEHAVTLRLAPMEQSLPHDESRGPRSIVPLVVGGAVVAVGLTAGIAFRLAANADDDHAAALRSRLGTGGCIGAAGASEDCAALRHDVDGASRSQTWSTVGFVVAGVGLVGTPIWWLLSPRPTPTQTAVSVSGIITPGWSAVVARGHF
jgi:tetratricopeptide (TPR) repeat protein